MHTIVASHAHTEITNSQWRDALTSTSHLRENLAFWASLQFPDRPAEEVAYDMECGVLIALQHGVDMTRAIRYAIVRGAIQKSLSDNLIDGFRNSVTPTQSVNDLHATN